MNYKETLHLPKTDFPLHIKGQVCKPDQYVVPDPYAFMRERQGENYVLHDGPPYANGDIHIGHAMNKILKDFALKIAYFSGRRPEYRPGWDCHGLPIERKVQELFGPLTDVASVREKCRDYAGDQIMRQMQQFVKLGVVADWDFPYITMDFKYEAMLYRQLCKLAKKGLLSRRLKPVYWSIAEKTSLADAEVVYKNKTDTSAYVAFRINDSVSFLVWTTTPWTLPANKAVCLNPNEKYVLLQRGDGQLYVVAATRADELAKLLDFKAPGSGFNHSFKECLHPLNPNIKVPVIYDEFVDMQTGTGCVHIAPGHGDIDYQIGLKHGLEVFSPVTDDGCFSQDVCCILPDVGSIFYGTPVLTHGNVFTLQLLEEKGTLVKTEKIQHEYPFCQRSDTPVIFRSVPNWFIDLKSIKEKAVQALDEVEFFPAEAKEKLKNMLTTRDEWCISRQRSWGVPIAFFEQGEGSLFDNDVLEHTALMFEQYGCDCWWTAEDNFFLPPSKHLGQSHLVKLRRCYDTLDVWFDSGLSWTEVGGHADLYLEGSDQFRGWFQSSLLLSIALQEKPPFDQIVTHGFVVDSKGHKMAKSVGNVVSPLEVIEKYGPDVLRMWVATTDYTEDVRLSDEQLERAKDLYNKVRNVLRYCLANMPQDRMPHVLLYDQDEWIIQKCQEVSWDVWQDFLKHRYQTGVRKLLDFLITDVSSIYFNSVKDRLYCESNIKRQSAQTALMGIFHNVVRLFAPILTYTTEEAISHAPVWYKEETPHVFALKPFDFFYAGQMKFNEGYWKEALKQFTVLFDSLKQQGLVKDLLEVVVVRDVGEDKESQSGEIGLTIQSEKSSAKKELGPAPVKTFTGAGDFFGVSDLGTTANLAYAVGLPLTPQELLGSFEVQGDKFTIYKSQAGKCPRCWKRTVRVGQELCLRCQGVLK